MPLGVAAGTPYGLVVFMTMWSKRPIETWLVAIAGIFLTIIGFFMSPATVSAMHAVIINRLLAIIIISASGILVIQRKKADKKISELNILSTTDATTHLRNRRAFNTDILAELERAKRYGRNLSLAVLDMDHFKLINDTFGHEKGDIMLKQLSYELEGQLRQSDFLYRLGGDEFAIIFAELNLTQARIACEKINHIHSQLALTIGKEKMTLSIGITSLQDNDDVDSFFKRADKALYHAKEHGRNRISTDHDISSVYELTQVPAQK